MNHTLALILDVPDNPVRDDVSHERQGTANAGPVRALVLPGCAVFREVVEAYQARVYSLVSRLILERSEVEEVAQEVFAKIYFSLHRRKSGEPLAARIYRVTVRECFRHIRMRSRPFAANRGAQTTEDRRRLAVEMLARIPNEDRTLLVLREIEGYSVEELSTMTGQSDRKITTKLLQARVQLLKERRECSVRGMLSRFVEVTSMSKRRKEHGNART